MLKTAELRHFWAIFFPVLWLSFFLQKAGVIYFGLLFLDKNFQTFLTSSCS